MQKLMFWVDVFPFPRVIFPVQNVSFRGGILLIIGGVTRWAPAIVLYGVKKFLQMAEDKKVPAVKSPF